MIIGDTPEQLGQIEAADAMMIDGKIVTRDDYRALAAQAEALRAGLNQAIELLATALVEPQQITEAEIYDLREIEQATPQQHLVEVRAQAVESFKADVINELEETVLVAYSGCRGTDASDLDDVKVIQTEKFEKFANQYADSIRQENK